MVSYSLTPAPADAPENPGTVFLTPTRAFPESATAVTMARDREGIAEMDLGLGRQVVIVTGAASGIGAAIARMLSGEGVALSVTSLGYSKLLMLSSRDFHALLARDEHLRERIQVVAKQRLRAIEVWKQFSQANATAAPAPAQAPVPSPAQAAAAAEAAANAAAPIINRSRRPMRSPSVPMVMSRPATMKP